MGKRRHLFNQVVKVNTSGWSHVVISYPLIWGSGELYFISGSLCKNSQLQTNQEKTSVQDKLRPSWKYITSTPQNCGHYERQGKTEKLTDWRRPRRHDDYIQGDSGLYSGTEKGHELKNWWNLNNKVCSSMISIITTSFCSLYCALRYWL